MEYILPILTLILVIMGSIYMITVIKLDLQLRKEKLITPRMREQSMGQTAGLAIIHTISNK